MNTKRQYEHRNGENKLPSESGDFGFLGQMEVGWRWQWHKSGIIHIVRHHTGELGIEPTTDDQKFPEHYPALDRCDGQWWGPIRGPWEKSDDQIQHG